MSQSVVKEVNSWPSITGVSPTSRPAPSQDTMSIVCCLIPLFKHRSLVSLPTRVMDHGRKRSVSCAELLREQHCHFCSAFVWPNRRWSDVARLQNGCCAMIGREVCLKIHTTKHVFAIIIHHYQTKQTNKQYNYPKSNTR